MSDRIRSIVKEYPDINIIHRSHPLRWDDQEEASPDWEEKWEVANRVDEKNRFNIEGMKAQNFKMPTARRAMIAIRAGTLAGGNEWDLFDRFQRALYIDNKNIADEEVIAQLIVEAGIDFGTFLKYYEDPKTEALEKEDFQKAEAYDLDLIPALVVEGEHVIQGTKRRDLAVDLLKKAADTEGIRLE